MGQGVRSHGYDQRGRGAGRACTIYRDEVGNGGTHVVVEEQVRLEFLDGSGDPCQFISSDTDDTAIECSDMVVNLPVGTEFDLRDDNISNSADPCAGGCTTVIWEQKGGDEAEQLLTALGVWNNLDATQQADVRDLPFTYQLDLAPAGTSCNGGADDRVDFDMILPVDVYAGILGADIYLGNEQSNELLLEVCYDVACAIDAEIQATFESEVVCE